MTELASDKCPLCPARVVWALDVNARWVPVDLDPSPEGTWALVLAWDGRTQANNVTSAARRFGRKLHTSHHQTCPKAKELRKLPRPDRAV